MSNATLYALGKGSVLSISTDDTTFTPVKQLKSISFSGDTQSYETITNMDSPGAQDEYAPTTSSPGTATAQGTFNPSGDPGQIMAKAARANQFPVYVKMQMAPALGQKVGFSTTFTAYVQEALGPVSNEYDKSAGFTMTLKITGPKTDVVGS